MQSSIIVILQRKLSPFIGVVTISGLDKNQAARQTKKWGWDCHMPETWRGLGGQTNIWPLVYSSQSQVGQELLPPSVKKKKSVVITVVPGCVFQQVQFEKSTCDLKTLVVACSHPAPSMLITLTFTFFWSLLLFHGIPYLAHSLSSSPSTTILYRIDQVLPIGWNLLLPSQQTQMACHQILKALFIPGHIFIYSTNTYWPLTMCQALLQVLGT